MTNVIYSVKTHELSYGDLKIKEVKIGRTSNINSTLAQYRRSHKNPELLDLWRQNEKLKISECEKGVLDLAEKYAHERSGETFRFLQNGYENFSTNISHLLVPTSIEDLERDEEEKEEEPEESELDDYTGERPDFFVLDEEYYEVNTWRELLEEVLGSVKENTDDFEKIQEIKGLKRDYFSKGKPTDMRGPKKLAGTSYYYESNLSANQIMNIVEKILDKFGYNRSDFKLKLK